jgi:hypothetical protein
LIKKKLGRSGGIDGIDDNIYVFFTLKKHVFFRGKTFVFLVLIKKKVVNVEIDSKFDG